MTLPGSLPVSALALSLAVIVSTATFAQQVQFDGPAELPRVYVHSAMADTPARGKVLTVHAGDNLQSAIAGANCGDTIQLQAGEVFSGDLHFPQKSCDDAHWIIVRTSASDSDLPAEGTRLKPCLAGVASLPGRPDFHCTNAHNVLARIEHTGQNGVGPLIFAPGANHYRFVGLEVTRAGTQTVYALATAPRGGPVDHIIFDRVWMHGTAQDETARAVDVTSMNYVALVDSFFTDFHCIAMTGACTDAQVVSTGGGRTPTGPFKIVNNFLEASAENVLFGGTGATETPADIEIRNNYFFKPLIWKPGEPGFVGGTSGKPFITKNLFELKNAQRVLFEGNLLENCWGGFSQNGYAILLSPKNQGNGCPICKVTDVTIRYNRIWNVGSVFELINVRSDAGGSASAGERYSIHDLVATGVRGRSGGYQGAGLFAQLLVVSPQLHDVHIEHVTAVVPHAIFGITNRERFTGFRFQNNILATEDMAMENEGGGPANCAFQPEKQGPSSVIKNCFENPTFTHNLMIGDGGWPSGNPYAKNLDAAGIKVASDDSGAPYTLCKEKDSSCKKTSPAIGAGSDGKDLGADLQKLEEMLANVR